MSQGLAPHLLSPAFRRVRATIEALHEVPDEPLPSSFEATLAGLSSLAVSEWPQRSLWIQCFWALRRYLARACLASLGATLGGLGAAFAGMEVIEEGQPLARGLLFACVFFASSLLYLVCAYANDLMRRYAWSALFAELSSRVLLKTSRLSPEARGEFSSGNLKVLIASDVNEVCEFFDNFLRNAVPGLIHLVVLTPFAWRLGGWAGVVGMAVACLIVPLAGGIGQWAALYENRVLHLKDEVTTVLGEWVRHVRAVRFLSWQEPIAREVASLMRRLIVHASKGHFLICTLFGTTFTWWMVSAASVVVSAKLLGITLGATRVFGVTWLIILTSRHLMHAANTVRLFAMASPSVKRLGRLFSASEATVSLSRGAALAGGLRPVALVFREVGVTLGAREILSRLSLRLDLCQRTALIGRVGCGKTTFLKLAAGVIPPSTGSMEVEFSDGSTRNLWEEEVYRRFRAEVAWVPQEPFVSNDTVTGNVALGGGDEGVWHAACLAELEADLKQWPQGVATEVGEQGVNLSGGQRQRVNLARAFYSRRAYLLLDDPLSAVDVGTELALVDNLLRHAGGFLLISHRMASLARMDRLLVLEDGLLVEEGSPAALAENPEGRFARVLKAYEGGEA